MKKIKCTIPELHLEQSGLVLTIGAESVKITQDKYFN